MAILCIKDMGMYIDQSASAHHRPILIPEEVNTFDYDYSPGTFNSKLLSAICQGDTRAAKRFLNDGGSVNASCRLSRCTALQVALAHGHNDIGQMLIEKNASLLLRNKDGKQAIHLAAALGNLNMVQTMLDLEPELVNSQVEPTSEESMGNHDIDFCSHDHEIIHGNIKIPYIHNGSTPLHAACQRLHLHCVLDILSRDGCQVDVKDERGLTPLDSVGYGFNDSLKRSTVPFSSDCPSPALQIVKALLSKGALMHSLGFHNQVATTCLHSAVTRQDISLIDFLLVNIGSCLLILNSHGLTPLHLAANGKLLIPLKIMLEHHLAKEVVNLKNNFKQTPLHLAVEKNWIPGINLLLEAGADTTAVDIRNYNMLHYAAGNSEILKILIPKQELNTMINSQNVHQESPLWVAVRRGDRESVTILLSHGAHVHVTGRYHKNLLHLASFWGTTATLQALLEDERLLLKKDAIDINGLTPLHLAAYLSRLGCVDALMEVACNVGAPTIQQYGDLPKGATPLHAAALGGSVEVMERLIKDVTFDNDVLNLSDGNGFTPLLVAIINNNKDCVKSLLLHGAKLSDTTRYPSPTSRKVTALELILKYISHPETLLIDTFDTYIKVFMSPPREAFIFHHLIMPPSCDDQNQFQIVQGLLHCSGDLTKERLLLHPVVESFLYLKWIKLRNVFFALMFFHFVFPALFTLMIFPSSASALQNKIFYWIPVIIWLILFNLQDFLMSESNFPRYQLISINRVLKYLTTGLTVATMVARGTEADWSMDPAPIAVICVWFQLIGQLSCWPTPGVYILMFFAVLRKVLQVICTFICIILGFIFASMIVCNEELSFNNLYKSITKIIVMTQDLEYSEGSRPNYTERSIVIMFVLLVSIVLMNLMTGLAVSDVKSLEIQGRAQCLLKQLKFFRNLEVLIGRVSYMLFPKYFARNVTSLMEVDAICHVFSGGHKQKHNILSRDLVKSTFDCIARRK